MTEATVAALAALVDGRVVGDGARVLRGLGDLRTAEPAQIGFVRHPRYADLARTTRAGAVLTAAELDTQASQILVADVHVAYAKVAGFFHPPPRATVHFVHPRAIVDEGARLEAPVHIGAGAVIGRCRIAAGTRIEAGTTIADGAEIGRDCVVHQNVAVYGRVRLGDRVVLHSGCVIGSDGFGYARDASGWIKVPQLGGVVIEDDVEFGAGCAVDCGALGDTRIGRGSKFDNHCHIAHNCNIGRDVLMAAGCAIAGSTTIGDRCIFGGFVAANGHISVAADVRVGGGSQLFDDIPEAGDYVGMLALDKKSHVRLMRKLRALAEGD